MGAEDAIMRWCSLRERFEALAGLSILLNGGLVPSVRCAWLIQPRSMRLTSAGAHRRQVNQESVRAPVPRGISMRGQGASQAGFRPS